MFMIRQNLDTNTFTTRGLKLKSTEF
jgi:hypothetical protein